MKRKLIIIAKHLYEGGGFRCSSALCLFIYQSNVFVSTPQNASCASLRGYFDCENGVECVPLAYKCDCVAQCSDGSDEADLWAGCIMSAADCVSKAGEWSAF